MFIHPTKETNDRPKSRHHQSPVNQWVTGVSYGNMNDVLFTEAEMTQRQLHNKAWPSLDDSL